MKKLLPLLIVMAIAWLTGCSTTSVFVDKKLVSSVTQPGKEKFLNHKVEVISSDKTNFKVKVTKSVSNGEICSDFEGAIIKTTKYYFMPIHAKSIHESYEYDDFSKFRGLLLLDLTGIPIVFDLFAPFLIEGAYERRFDNEKFQIYSPNIIEVPISNDQIEVHTNTTTIAKIKTNSDGIANINIADYPITLQDTSDIHIQFKYQDALADATVSGNAYTANRKKRSKPCDLLAEVLEFNDQSATNPNNAVDAAEESFVKIRITNKGGGTGFNVGLVSTSDNSHVTVPGRIDMGDIAPGQTKTVTVAVKGDLKTTDGKVDLSFFAEEERGYGSNTSVKELKTVAMIPTGLDIVQFRVLDGKTGLAKGNGNGIPENGETFELEVFVKNSGKGEARQVTVETADRLDQVTFKKKTVALGNIAPGQTVTGNLVVELARAYNGEMLKPKITARDTYNVGKVTKTLDVPVRLQKPVLAVASAIKGQIGTVIRNGDQASVVLSVYNRGGIDAKNVRMTLSLVEKGPSISGEKILDLGDIPAGTESNPFRVNVTIPRTYQGKGVTMNVALAQNEFGSLSDIAVIPVTPSSPQLAVSWQIQSGMVDNKIQLGQAARLKMVVENLGEIDARNVVLRLGSNDASIVPQFPDGESQVNINTLPPGERMEQDFIILARKNQAVKQGDYQVNVSATQKDFPALDRQLAFKTLDSVEFGRIAAIQSGGSTYVASTIPPQVWITYPSDSMTLDDDVLNLQGYAHDDKGISKMEIRVNGELLANDGDRALKIKNSGASSEANRTTINRKIKLKEGSNRIEIVAWDTDNLENRKSVSVVRSKMKSEIWAAVIGINDYKSNDIPDLKYAVSDAQAMVDYLGKRMNVPKDHIFYLDNEKATKQNVEKLLGDTLPQKANPQDTVIIYYSGHGAPYPDKSSSDGDNISKYLLTSDTDPSSMWSTAVAMDNVRTIFSRLPSERVIFLADTCYSGASGGKTFTANTRAVLSDNFLERMATGRGRVIITASGAGELAREDKQLDGGHGVFTYYLLDGLRGGADSDKDGLITAGEAYAYVSRKVSDHTKNEQHPVKKGEEERPIILGVVR